MQPIDIIYFTKEDGKNKYLVSSYSRITSIYPDNDQMKIFEKILGHKPFNVYVLLYGIEIDVTPHPPFPEGFFAEN